MDEKRQVSKAVRLLCDNPSEGDILMDTPETSSWQELREAAKDEKAWKLAVRAIKDVVHIQATKDNDKKRKNKRNSGKNYNKKKKKEEAGESASAASVAAKSDGDEGDEEENEDSDESDDGGWGGWGTRKRAPRKKILQTIRCNDGFSMSVQASREHYCTPRNDEGPYTHVEVGYPNELDERLMPYADGGDGFQIVGMRPMLYVNVPAHVICSVTFQHGGKYSGQLPNMVDVGEDGVQWAAAAAPPSDSSTEEEETEVEEEERNENTVGSPSSAVHMGAAPPPPPPTHTQVGAMTPPTPLTRLVLSPIERNDDDEEF